MKKLVMKILFLSAFFLSLFVSAAMSQTIQRSKTFSSAVIINGQVVKDLDHLHIRVCDSLSGSALNGAVVEVAYKKDTVIKVQYSGYVEFNRSLKDSLTISVSYLGYKPFRQTFLAKEMYGAYDILMVENPMEISELVIVGKSLAMIVRGDTVIYNANKFNTLMGDNLGELIKQMPGLDYNSGALTYNGEPISRITIGGEATLWERCAGGAHQYVRRGCGGGRGI